MARKSPTSIRIKPNLRCHRVYPTEKTSRSIAELKTVGFTLTRDQAVNLSRALLAVTQDWKQIDVTAFRLKRRKSDGSYMITVTSTDR
jgi:hypothetical protein